MSDRDARLGVRFRRIYSVELVEGPFRSLDDGERVVWVYCKTGLQSTSIGIYRLSSAVAAEDLGNVTAAEFDRRFHAVCQACGWLFDEAVRVLWIPEWLADNPPQSPNVVTSWRKLLNSVPDCSIKAGAVEAIHRYLKDLPESFRKAFGSYRVSLPEAIEISKAQPKAQPQSHQGSGSQGSGDPGEREQAATTRQTADTVQTPSNQPNPTFTKIDAIVQQAKQHFYKGEALESRLDAVRSYGRASGLNVIPKADIIAALARNGVGA